MNKLFVCRIIHFHQAAQRGIEQHDIQQREIGGNQDPRADAEKIADRQGNQHGPEEGEPVGNEQDVKGQDGHDRENGDDHPGGPVLASRREIIRHTARCQEGDGGEADNIIPGEDIQDEHDEPGHGHDGGQHRDAFHVLIEPLTDKDVFPQHGPDLPNPAHCGQSLLRRFYSMISVYAVSVFFYGQYSIQAVPCK